MTALQNAAPDSAPLRSNMPPAEQVNGQGVASASPSQTGRWIVLGLLVTAVIVCAVLFRDTLSLSALARHEAAFRTWQNEHPVLLVLAAFLLYVAITGLSLPGAAAMTLVIGWTFGVVWGSVLVSFASTTGATLAFLLSRYLLRDSIEHRFGERLHSFNAALEREGAFYLFTLRLIPAVPFFVINLVMGLTRIRASTFWWVSQVGMLPGTIAYVYAGSQVPSLQVLADQGARGILQPGLLAAFVVLGLLPLVLRKLVLVFAPARATSP